MNLVGEYCRVAPPRLVGVALLPGGGEGGAASRQAVSARGLPRDQPAAPGSEGGRLLQRWSPSTKVVAFYNGRGTAEQWIKEGKNAVKWTRLSCTTFRANAVQLHALAYNLANFLRGRPSDRPLRAGGAVAPRICSPPTRIG